MSITMQDVIAELRGDVPLIPDTADTLEGAAMETPVKGIAVAFMPSQTVIEQAVALGANLLVVHESPYYSHRPEHASHLADDPVCRVKRDFLRQSGLAVYRHHDYCHRLQPDPIMSGLLQSLAWEAQVEAMLPTAAVVRVPAMRASELAAYAKAKLSLPYVRLTGDPDMRCERVGVLVGYRGGGANAIPLFREHKLDLVLAGEGPEWETPEYVRDAASQGSPKSLLAIGHAESEEPGMRAVAEQLRGRYSELPVHFIPGQPVFRVI
ncbi:Nif3-like dinuclear metal center hexameric protein [Paenibacillus methanolicus]|uniref:GTP cyclohydrolase 1 type 2 homolog n=1 Tax=Paenibacillus methanolicus TaxID=582686 RepID=A0A5S5C5R1_9BACL|nr:Nif3-like dinuclear metal center hexameric protein [Paenibacillus methanolicus]TYP74664.1 putative NIF3 family GTP cyclohydrolase 1 type 2 [Paenibacillus methanolicus]